MSYNIGDLFHSRSLPLNLPYQAELCPSFSTV
jgi:hypothetical protein